MNGTYGTKTGFNFAFFGGAGGDMWSKKYGADKIALLCLFIVALLAARFVIALRSAVVLSGPIKLNYAGLSVSIPAGNGWKSKKQWKYQKDAFVLSSFFDSGSGNITALVRCRYLLATPEVDPDVLFKEKALTIGGVIAETGQAQTGGPDSVFSKGLQNGASLIIDWAHIKKPKALFDTFFGTTRLPNSRQFNIEVYQTMGDTELAKRVFERIIGSFEFEGNRLLEAGSEIIAAIKSKGLSSFPATAGDKQEQGREVFFLIKDAKGRSIGFTMDVLGSSVERLQSEDSFDTLMPEGQLNIQGMSLFYIQGRYTNEQIIFFQSRNNLDEFAWKSEVSGSAGKSATEVILDEDGMMTVRKYGTRAKEKNYQFGPVAIPVVFGELTLSQMLESGHKEIFVDVIDADGTILPTLVSRIEAKDITANEEAAYIFGVESLDGSGVSQRIYLDDQGQISKRILRQEGIYTIERAGIESILRQFPERADYILQKNKMLEQNPL
ncbi:MAG: hypothetical protein ACYS0C_07945 [Planctomycetota bacterium]|jgi:hypothetical protein